MTNTLPFADLTTATDEHWWRNAAVYQIYPRSFADSNGDGLGDLPGITSRIPYLRKLGVDAVWLSPFYPSALADGGYDVDDYRDVDPRIGTLAEFGELAGALHDAGLRLIVDIVPNHMSTSTPAKFRGSSPSRSTTRRRCCCSRSTSPTSSSTTSWSYLRTSVV